MIDNEADLVNQITLFSKSQKERSKSIDILWELVIKNGLSLTEKIETITLASAEKIYVTRSNRIAFCLDAYTEAVHEAVTKLKPKTVLCLDSVFAKDDCFKTNVHLKLQDSGIEFKTV